MPRKGISNGIGKGARRAPPEPVNFLGVDVLGLAKLLNVHICSASCVHLTPDDVRILVHLAHGASNAEIGRALSMTESKVRERLSTMYKLSGAQDRTQLAVLMVKHGLVD